MIALPPLLAIDGVTKAYPGVAALADVRFDLAAGEVHALMGENGAGKSTLCRILAGIERPDSGALRLRGAAYAPADRNQAQRQGVGMVLQELNLIANLTVAESVFLGRLPNRAGWIDFHAMESDARALLATIGLEDLPPARLVRTLGVGQQQLVEIAAALSRRCDLLILDEPTAALSQREAELLFAQIRRLKAKGVGILYVSHRMEEVLRLADRITVLRDGRRIATADAREVDGPQLIRWMVGRDLPEPRPRGRAAGALALRVEGRVSFELHRGEILGFAGLMGSGRTETMRAIFGADPMDGEVYLHGSPTPARIRSPRDAVRQGIALLTEDRKQQGLLLPLGIVANITLTRLEGVLLRPSAERAAAQRWRDALDLRCRDLDQVVGELSGGNQQKVVIAKWLFRDCDILIFDEPTRGIDVGAKFEIYRLLDDLVQRGKAVIVVSSDLPELMAICDRIAVMSAGALAGVFRRGEWSQDALMEAALRGHRGLS
jgi:ribose transport system ATP-binding protein